MRYVPFDSKLSPNKWVYVALFAAIAVLYGIASPPVSLSDTAITSDACYMAQKFVRQKLKAPATAQFPESTEANCQTTQAAGTWTVTSYVDAQNGFGAMIRTDYMAQMSHNANTDTWTLIEIEMLD